jgi:hypothetical protein
VQWLCCADNRPYFHPEKRWKYPGDAERWEHLAEAEISALFEQCNTTKPEVCEIRPAA